MIDFRHSTCYNKKIKLESYRLFVERGKTVGKLAILCMGCCLLLQLSNRRKTAGIAQGKHFMYDRTDKYMLIAILWMTCFSFLRTNYNDTHAYINSFRNALSVSESAALGVYTKWTDNPLSHLYQDFMRGITDNYHVYFLFPALLQSIAVVKLIRHYSDDPALSLLIYFSLGTYMLFVAAFKQSMAMTILMLALPYVDQKKYLRFYIMVTIAMLFHFYAIIFIFVPLMRERPWKGNTWFLLGLVLVCLQNFEETLGSLIAQIEAMGESISEEEVFDGNSINLLRVLVYWVPAALALVFQRHLFYESTPTDHLFANISIMAAMILTIGLAQGANLFARMAGYFELGIAVTLPWMLKKIFNRASAKMVSLVAAVLFFGYFVYEFTVAKDFAGGYSSISLLLFFRELLR